MSRESRVAEIFAVIVAISCLAFPCNLPIAYSSLNKTEIGTISQQLVKAADYIKNRYDDRMGMATESEDQGLVNGVPRSRTFWIYSDNLWASEAMRPFYPEIALNISESIAPYIDAYNESDMYEVALGTRVPMPLHTNLTISIANVTLDDANYTILANRHEPQDGAIFTDAASYADLSFYLSLDYYLNHNMVASEYWFRTGEAMWNGTGFFDKPANTDQVYQNYKLGLYLLCVKVTGYDSAIYDEVETTLWSHQIANGGIASLSYFNGTTCGTANVETTSISLLAYDEQLIQNFGQPKVGAYFYPWWGIPFNNHWDSNAIKGTPFLGEYNSNDSHIADQQILFAKQHKIDFFSVSWIGQGTWVDWTDQPDKRWDFDKIDHNVNNTLVPEIEKENFTFCLMYETSIVLNNSVQYNKNFTDIFLNDLTYAKQYFDSPNYLRVDGKPVFFIYNLAYLYNTINDTTAVHGLLDDLRQLFQKSEGIYLIGDLGSGRNTPQDVSRDYLYSLNATTFYLYSSVAGGWNSILGNATACYPIWLSEMNRQSIGFVPNVYPGYDNTNNTDGSPPAVLAPDETMFARFLEIAKNNTDSALGMIMVTSWNEWMEATEIEPSMESGELFLQTTYDVVPMLKEFAPRLAGVVSLFNVRFPSRQYDPNYDINSDGKINMRDISIIIRYIASAL